MVQSWCSLTSRGITGRVWRLFEKYRYWLCIGPGRERAIAPRPNRRAEFYGTHDRGRQGHYRPLWAADYLLQRVGGDKTVSVDVRILAATNKNLETEVAEGRFREDLYYRLNVMALSLPPLRDRHEDIPLLASHFLSIFAEKNGKAVKGFTPSAMDKLLRYPWPGNVRELENIVERATILLINEYVSEREFPANLLQSQRTTDSDLISVSAPMSLEEIERVAVLEAIKSSDGNKTEAAKILGITRKTLHAKLQKYEMRES